MYKNLKIGIVIPAYNEEKLISFTLADIPQVANRVYLIDDGSTDNTYQYAKAFINKRLCILRHNQNRGVGASIADGYKMALEDNMDIVAIMDGDHQMDAKLLPKLLDTILEDGADFAKGNRLSKSEHRLGMSMWRFFGNWVLTMLTKIASGYWEIRDPQNCFTAITRNTLERIDLDRIYPRYGYCNDLLIKLNALNCKVIDVPMYARYGVEKSKIKYGQYAITVSWLLLKGYLWRLWEKYLRKFLLLSWPFH